MLKATQEMVEIISERDGMTILETVDFINDTLQEMECYIEDGDFGMAIEIFESDLGLEIDYLI